MIESYEKLDPLKYPADMPDIEEDTAPDPETVSNLRKHKELRATAVGVTRKMRAKSKTCQKMAKASRRKNRGK